MGLRQFCWGGFNVLMFGQSAGVQGAPFWRLGGNNPSPQVGLPPVLGTMNGHALRLVAGGQEWMRITPAGRVVVGSSQAPAQLELSGRLLLMDTAQQSQVWEFRPAGSTLEVGVGSGAVVPGFGRPCTRIVLVPEDQVTGDLVGVGTRDPQKKLHVFTDHRKVRCQPVAQAGPPQFSHEGIRLENITWDGNVSVWDLEPKWDSARSEPYLGIGIPGQQRTHTLRIYQGRVHVHDTLASTFLHIVYHADSQAVHLDPSGLVEDIHFPTSKPSVVKIHTSTNQRWAMEIVNAGTLGKGLRIVAGHHASSTPVKPVFAVYSNGTTYARRLKVTLYPFPDYVFAPDYELLPIEEKARYWQRYKRLPGFPSAEEVERKGADVAQLIRLLVEEVEELNLRVYQLWKENQELRKKIARLER